MREGFGLRKASRPFRVNPLAAAMRIRARPTAVSGAGRQALASARGSRILARKCCPKMLDAAVIPCYFRGGSLSLCSPLEKLLCACDPAWLLAGRASERTILVPLWNRKRRFGAAGLFRVVSFLGG